MRKLSTLLALLLFAGLSAAARADSINYNVAFTPSAAGDVAISGVFTVTSAPMATGITTYTGSQISAFSLKTPNFTFSTANGTLTDIIFTNGVLSSIDYSGTAGMRPSTSTLTLSGTTYTLANPTLLNNPNTGTISAVAATPEPSSLLLLGTGVLGMLAFLWKYATDRRRSEQQLEATFA